MKFLNHTLIAAPVLWSTSALANNFDSTSDSIIQPKIVGGEEAKVGEFPYIVSLQTSSGSHFCGGSLINSSWVLTAGHCVRGGYLGSIAIGVHDQDDKSRAEVFKVKKVVIHPNYSSAYLDYDFALVELDGKSKYPAIAINKKEINIPENRDDQIMSVTAGWGALKEGSYSLATKLQKVDVPLVSQKTCFEAYKDFNDVTDRMICAGYDEGGKDACQGDSGGPLVVKNENGSHTLVGIVSWGQGCARPRLYGVYSKVNSVHQWIQQTAK